MLRALSWVFLALAAVAALLAAVLLAPRDSVEFLAGFIAGSLSRLRLIVVGVAILLGAIGLGLHRGRRIRSATGGVGALLLLVLLVAARRQLRYPSTTLIVDEGGERLEGTLWRPKDRASSPRPAVLLLHGSGPMSRQAYFNFARHFLDHGFVVLTVDKRGVGGSTGTYYGDDLGRGVIETRAREARAALGQLARQAGVDTARLGVFAVSQGGWVAPLLLQGDTPARYAVCFSCSAVSSGEEGAWSEWSGEDRDHFGLNPPAVPFEEMERRLTSVKPSAFDPRPVLPTMTAPSIWLYGEWDNSQPSAPSKRVLDSLALGHLTVRMFSHANHALMISRGPGGRRFPDFAPGVWDTVFAWTARQGITRQ